MSLADWPTSTSLSAWLAAERARASSGSHRAWIDEALRQAQAAGTLRAELQHALASVQSLQHVLDVLAQRLQQVLDEDGR